MTRYYVVMFGDMSRSEAVLSTERPLQALFAIHALSKVAPDIEVRLRVMDDGEPCVLTVLRGQWRCHGISKLQEAA